jgi:hypothetical protein
VSLTPAVQTTDRWIGARVRELLASQQSGARMVTSPISIPLLLSQSLKPRDLAKVQSIAADAIKIERYINSRMDKEFVREFDFDTLATDLSMDQARVAELLGKYAGHPNTISVCNPQKRPKKPAAGRLTVRGTSHTDVGSNRIGLIATDASGCS